MQLLPCVLLGDFGVTMLADTLTTEQRYRWNTSDAVNFNIDHTRAQAIVNRRSLRIGTTALTGNPAEDLCYYGLVGTPVDETDIMNAFGNDVNDLTWCTNLGAWLYHTDDTYDTDDPDQFVMYISNNGGTDVDVNWTSDFDTADKWEWISSTPDGGTFAANGDNISHWGFKGNDDALAGYTAASYFYINNFVAYRNVLSTTSHDYTFTNGIKLHSSSCIPTGWNSWRVTGNIVGPLDAAATPRSRIYDLERQLHEMATLGVAELQPLRRPSPKYQALSDCDNIKTYLMLQTETLGSSDGWTVVTSAVPVIITNVSTEWVAPSKNLVSFSFDALRWAGV